MPCDGGDQIIEDSANRFTWVGDHRLQAGYWHTAGVDPKFMMLAYQTWFEAFVKAIDSDLSLSQQKKMAHAYTQSLKINTYHIVRLYGRKKTKKER